MVSSGFRLHLSSRARVAALAVLAAAASHCAFPAAAPVPPPVTPADAEAAKARFPEATEQSLNTGRELFASKCNGCHNYPDVEKTDDSRWPGIMQSMGKKAGLDDAQSHSVLSFILVSRSKLAKAQ